MKETLSSRNSTVVFIKKSTRSLWASVLRSTLEAADKDFFGPLLLAPKLCLCSPPRGGKGRSEGYTARRLELFARGEYQELVDTLPRGKFKAGKSNDMGDGVPEYVEEIINDLVAAGNTSKATRVLASEGVAPYGDDTFEALKSKHPEGPEVEMPADLPPAVRVGVKRVREALKSFAPRSAPGPSGLRPEHLKHALSGDNFKDLEGLLTSFVNRFLSGSIPLFIMPFLSSARLIPLLKKQGEADIRPVAIGETLRRLAAKCAWLECREEAVGYLSPLQLGAGVPLASEAIARASAVMFNNHRRDADFVQWDVDLANAFNEIHRDQFLAEVRSKIPGLARFAYACYAQRSFLFYGDYVLISSQGTQQGDPLGGLFFALGLHPVIKKVHDRVPGLLLHVWFFDDGRLDGPVWSVLAAWGILRADLPGIGLQLKLQKCKLAFSAGYEAAQDEALRGDAMDIDFVGDAFPTEMERVMDSAREEVRRGYVTMGVPIGTKEFVDKFFESKLEKIKTLHRRIGNLRRMHSQLWILRNCASVCKLMYWMRIMDPETITPHLKAFDKMQFTLLQEIVGVDFDALDKIQAKLPLSCSGLVGLRSAEDHASAAFLAGSKNSESLVRLLVGNEDIDALPLNASMTIYNSKVGLRARLDAAKLGATQSIEQKSLSIAIDKYTESSLIEMVNAEIDPEVKSLNLDRLLSLKVESSFAWLLAVPNSNLGLSMTNEELQFALQIRLGHVGAGPFRCSGNSQHEIERTGLELLKCNKLQKVRHDVIASVITNIARASGEHPTRENLGLFGDGSRRRPGDIVLPSFNRGGKTVMDVRVTNNKQDFLTRYVPKKAGRAAEHGASVKIADWKKHCDEAFERTRTRVESTFVPLSTDVYGCWTRDAYNVFYELAKKRKDYTDRDPELEYKYIIQQISMALQRENAKILAAHRVRRIGALDGDEEDEVVLMSEDEAVPIA